MRVRRHRKLNVNHKGKERQRSSLRLLRNLQALGIGYFPHRKEVGNIKKENDLSMAASGEASVTM